MMTPDDYLQLREQLRHPAPRRWIASAARTHLFDRLVDPDPYDAPDFRSVDIYLDSLPLVLRRPAAAEAVKLVLEDELAADLPIVNQKLWLASLHLVEIMGRRIHPSEWVRDHRTVERLLRHKERHSSRWRVDRELAILATAVLKPRNGIHPVRDAALLYAQLAVHNLDLSNVHYDAYYQCPELLSRSDRQGVDCVFQFLAVWWANVRHRFAFCFVPSPLHLD